MAGNDMTFNYIAARQQAGQLALAAGNQCSAQLVSVPVPRATLIILPLEQTFPLLGAGVGIDVTHTHHRTPTQTQNSQTETAIVPRYPLVQLHSKALSKRSLKRRQDQRRQDSREDGVGQGRAS